MRDGLYFVSGIDTDAGKSYVTGLLARSLAEDGRRVITMKMVQTGCNPGEISEDIAIHRRLMGIPLLPEDTDHTTCPVRLAYPASPDLAARLEGVETDLAPVMRNAASLRKNYDVVLIEGAGGLMVPIKGPYTMIDYVCEHNLPLVLVSNPRLGSLNHTLLSLGACKSRGVDVAVLAFNLHPVTSDIITSDTRDYLRRHIGLHHPGCEFIEFPYTAM